MTTAKRREAADFQARTQARRGRGLRLNLLAVLLTMPWLNVVVWWQGWPAWLLVLPVFLATRWLLAGLTDPRRVSDLERRVAALEEPEAGGGGRAWSGPGKEGSGE